MSEAFTAEQQQAIARRDGPLALAASAGSGKTSVLVERYVRSVLEDEIAPGRILAITFTDRAAGELRERVRRRLAAAGEREAARASAGAFVSTFHGFCARLLRAHAVLVGLAPDFSVLGDAQAAELREAAFDLALTAWLDGDGALDLAAAFGVAELRGAIDSVYDELRSRGERVPAIGVPTPRHGVAVAAARLARAASALDGAASDEYEAARSVHEKACADELGIAAVGLLDGLLGAFAQRYEALKRGRGAVDFDDLELEAGALLAGHGEVRALWRERFERLMVDELQDTNARQMAILAALDCDNLFTVGDEFQSIYGFRHADVALFRERRARLERAGRAGVLSTNFRARAPLLEAVNAVFGARFGEGFVPLVAGRGDDPAHASQPLVELLVTDTDGWERHEQGLGVELAPAPLWRRAEARLLARRVDQLISSGDASPEEIVLLFRAGGAISVYEAALADLGHATLATTGGGFFARPEVVDLVAYVRALANPLDELALHSVLASPLCGCSPDVMVALALRSRERECSIWEVLETEPPDHRSAAFAERFADARRAADDSGLGEIVADGVAAFGYDRYLCALHAPERRIANVRKLERLAREFEARDGRDLRRFAAALAAGRVGSVRETEAPPPAAGTGAIRLMTIHSAKGLEFPVVCLADLAHQLVTREPPLLVDGGRIGLRLPTFERKTLETLDYAELRAERAGAAFAEEQRIIYVAMTRARERLILSGAARFARWPPETSSAMAWLGPALVGDLAARADAGGGVTLMRGAGGVAMGLTLCTAHNAEALLGLRPAGSGGFDEEPEPPRTQDDPMPDVAARMRVSAPKPTALSYTAIAEYERCAYRYHLQRVIGLPDVDPPGGDGDAGAADRGVVVHALLERLDFAATHEPSEVEVADAAALAGVVLEPHEDRAALAMLAGAFARSPLCGRLARARDVRREEPFAFALRGEAELLRGFLDVAAVEPDGTLLIVDYKSDRLVDGMDLAAHVDRDYSVQRLVYALAGLASGAPAVEVAHCFLRRPEVLLATRHEASERARLEEVLAARLGPLRAGRFEVSGDPNRERCGSCPGRLRLCSYEELLTLR